VNARHDLAAPPPRLAAGEPGWKRFRQQLRVFLDRAELDRCTAYDVERGTVTVQRTAGGKPFMDPLTRLPATATLTGLVEVQWK